MDNKTRLSPSCNLRTTAGRSADGTGSPVGRNAGLLVMLARAFGLVDLRRRTGAAGGCGLVLLISTLYSKKRVMDGGGRGSEIGRER